MATLTHLVRCAHQLCLENSNVGILQIDISNAFNTIRRETILNSVYSEFPQISRWAQWSLCHAGALLVEDTTLKSTTGVQQGDPMGPFLFAAGLQSVIAPLLRSCNEVMSKYFLDDGVHVAEIPILDGLLRDLKPLLAGAGLSLNILKCRLFTKGDPSALVHLGSVPVEREGLEFLGSPIGSDHFINDSLTLAFAKALDFCDQVAKVEDPQTCHHLLRLCAGTCRVLHLMKVVLPTIILHFLQQLDDKTVATFEDFMGLSVGPLERQQLFLPTKRGGCGLREGCKLAAAAFVTTLLKFRCHGVPQLSIPLSLARTAADLTAGLASLREVVPPAAHPAYMWISDHLSSGSHHLHPDYSSLTWWSTQIAARAYDVLVEQSPGRDRARLRCLANPVCGAWLDACPVDTLGLRIPPAEYTVLGKLLLGLPILPVDVDLVCNQCGDCMDPFGDHLLCCKKGGLTQRHTAIVSHLWHMCTAAGFNVTCEVSLDGRTRPADLLLAHWTGRGPCAVDVSVVHPLAPSTPCHTVKNGTEAIVAMEGVKHTKYTECCRQSNTSLNAFVLSTFGMLGEEAERFFRCISMARRRRALDDDDPQDLRRYMQQLQITLKREIARMLLQGPLDCAHGSTLNQQSSLEQPDAYSADGCDDTERVLQALSSDSEPMQL